MTVSKEAYCHAGDSTNNQNLKKRLRRLEFCLLLAIAGMCFLAIRNSTTASSLSARVQVVEDEGFPSLHKMNDRITVLSETFSTQLEEQRNSFSERFARFEENKKYSHDQFKTNEKFSTQLEEQRNSFSERFARFEESKKYSHDQFKTSETFSTQLEEQRNSFSERFARFEESKKYSNNYFNLYNKDKHLSQKSAEEFKNKMSKSLKYEQKRPFLKRTKTKERKLQTNQNSSFCDGTFFQLSIHLDKFPGDTSWELIDSVNEKLITSKSYEEAEPYSVQNSTICIPDGSYVFSIFDNYGDGMCLGVYDCSPYNITINTELLLEGSDFDSKQSHSIIIYNDNICVGNFIELQIQMNENVFSERSWELIDTESNKVLANQTENKNSICVDDGIYVFSLLNLESENLMDNEYMKITVNGDVLIDGPLLIHYRFRIIDGLTETYDCTSKPILNPINDLTGNVYDERISKLLEVFESLSSHDIIHNDQTPQYKAACYVLFDDTNNMTVEDDLTMERYILYLFLISTEVLTWGEALPSNFCAVNGVRCDQDGHIIEFLFQNRNLMGTIPTELGHLKYLRNVFLHENDLIGTIPSQLGRLSHLFFLFLHDNNLSGTIPSELGNLKKLRYLWLRNNNLIKSIPSQLFSATELMMLDLGGNRLTGSISTSIGQIDKLEILYLNNNQLTGSLPTQVGLMSSLQLVYLYNNQLVGQIPTEIGNWRNIEQLYLYSNQLSGTLPNVFDNLTQLRWFYAYDNSFMGEIPSSLWRADLLEYLRLQHNDLHGSVPDDHCDKLSTLKLDDSDWFIDSPKVDCSCCDKFCQFWDTMFSPTGPNTICPYENILFLYDEYGISSTNITDIHTKETVDGLYNGICSSPTGCYNLAGEDKNDKKDKEWYIGYSNKNKSIVFSDPKNPICDAVEICDQSIDSSHPRRSILNYFMRTLITNSSILYDSDSFEYKALCWMMGDENDVGIIDNLDECDGTLFQFCIMGLFFSSTNYLNSLKPFSSSDYLCDFDGIECDASNRFITAINFSNKNLTGSLISEIGLIDSIKKIDLSDNQMKGTIDDAISNNNLPNLEVFDVSNNTFEGDTQTMQKLLSRPSLKDLDISSNLFVGTLPSSFPYPPKLESFVVADNLLQGGIPDDLFACLQLRTIDLSQNKFNATVPNLLGQLYNIVNIRFNENEIRGNLPTGIFGLTKIKEIMMQSNKLTGSIPTIVGNLKNLKRLVLNHNNLKGNIPSELDNLKQLEIIHLHHNQLTGSAPSINATGMTSFITDCGFPNYALPKPLKCNLCTMCCNSEGACQEFKSNENNWKTSIKIIGLTMLGYISFLSLRSIIKSAFGYRQMKVTDIYTDTSVHSFIFAKGIIPKIIYSLSMVLQFALFVVYMLASDINKESTDWNFTYQCPDNSIDCIDLKKVNNLGWAMFTIVIMCFIGPDIVMSVKQLNIGIIQGDATLQVSGSVLLFLTIFAIYCSFLYNGALAEKNTDLIFNAVVLIFIMELDDQMYKIFKKLFPKWTQNVEEDVKDKMK